MTMDTSFIDPQTQSIFKLLSRLDDMKSFCLIGGTAIAIQAQHRNSLDLDFAVFGAGVTLPTFHLDALIRTLKSTGHDVRLVTNPEQITATKINQGINLLDYIRDYVIDGVKVQFLANQCSAELKDVYAQYFLSDPRQSTFSVLSLKGLAINKSLLLTERVKSRDLFDLMWLMKNQHLTLDEMMDYIKRYSSLGDEELIKNRLMGIEPLDTTDEGLDPVGVVIAMEDIYRYFEKLVLLYEQNVAIQELRSLSLFNGNANQD